MSRSSAPTYSVDWLWNPKRQSGENIFSVCHGEVPNSSGSAALHELFSAPSRGSDIPSGLGLGLEVELLPNGLGAPPPTPCDDFHSNPSSPGESYFDIHFMRSPTHSIDPAVVEARLLCEAPYGDDQDSLSMTRQLSTESMVPPPFSARWGTCWAQPQELECSSSDEGYTLTTELPGCQAGDILVWGTKERSLVVTAQNPVKSQGFRHEWRAYMPQDAELDKASSRLNTLTGQLSIVIPKRSRSNIQ